MFILSTHGEGLPYVLCEAMASKKAVIATNVRGCRDIVTNESGLLVAHGDFAKLAEGIVFLLSNPEVAADMGKNGRKLVEENYTLFKQSSDIINIYNEYIW